MYLEGDDSCGWLPCAGGWLIAPQVLMWTKRVRFCRNSLPHVGHDSGLRPCWRSWFTSSNLRKKPAPQSGQLYGLSPPWNRECITRCSSRENDSPHTYTRVSSLNVQLLRQLVTGKIINFRELFKWFFGKLPGFEQVFMKFLEFSKSCKIPWLY